MNKLTHNSFEASFVMLGALLSLTLGSSLVLSSSHSNAASTSANASVTVGSACSLTTTGNNSHTATISPGTYTPDIGSTTITVTCNDPGGYALYAIGYTNDTYGTTTLDGVSSGQTIATGTNTGTSGSSNWAMKLTPVSGTYAPTITTGYEAYHAVPSTYTKIASFANPTDIGSNATGSKLTATYAAFIAGDQSADTYNGKVKYTMVHPSTESPKDGPMACSSNKSFLRNGNSQSSKGSETQIRKTLLSGRRRCDYRRSDARRRRDHLALCRTPWRCTLHQDWQSQQHSG